MIALEIPIFPHDFTQSVADGAEAVIYDHLKTSAPDMAALLDKLVILLDYTAHAMGGHVARSQNEEIADILSDVTLTLANLGRHFHSQGDGEELTPHLEWLRMYGQPIAEPGADPWRMTEAEVEQAAREHLASSISKGKAQRKTRRPMSSRATRRKGKR